MGCFWLVNNQTISMTGMMETSLVSLQRLIRDPASLNFTLNSCARMLLGKRCYSRYEVLLYLYLTMTILVTPAVEHLQDKIYFLPPRFCAWNTLELNILLDQKYQCYSVSNLHNLPIMFVSLSPKPIGSYRRLKSFEKWVINIFFNF